MMMVYIPKSDLLRIIQANMNLVNVGKILEDIVYRELNISKKEEIMSQIDTIISIILEINDSLKRVR